MYILNKDFQAHTDSHSWDIISRFQDDHVINMAKRAAIEQAKSMMRMRHDISQEFNPITEWDNSKQYNEDDRVYTLDQNNEPDTIYVALNDHSGTDPSTPGQTDWEMKDPRDPIVLMMVIDMAIYHMYAKVPNRQTPQEVAQRYDDALDFFKGVAAGDYATDLPDYPDDVDPDTTFPQIGYTEKLNNDW